jgi:formamidopyrimidine-DNA glycosylase
MPELPEVEVTRRRISPFLLNQRVREVHTTPPSYFFLTPPAELRERLTGRCFTALERRGKYLIATLDDGSGLLLHLGMTGQLFADGAANPRLMRGTAAATLKPGEERSFQPDKHTHLALYFDGARAVYFRDTRKFGKIEWLPNGAQSARVIKLGPDALTADAADVHARIHHRTVPIKTVLLDQSVLAGAGNIYADEALFLAGVRPSRPAHRVSLPQTVRILDGLRQVLLRSIETGGSSISDYVTPDGSDGGYQNERRVYGLEGAPCPRCGTPIKRIVLGQRSSHFCPKCQR